VDAVGVDAYNHGDGSGVALGGLPRGVVAFLVDGEE
jgi:hypothetical protein